MERTTSKKSSAASLPDDLILEILTRVPYKSLCRFKCVSRQWLALCSDPGVRRKCPKTLSGFFYGRLVAYSEDFAITITNHFVNASGRGRPMVDPSLPFLPPGHRSVYITDCCNGLLLYRFMDVHSQVRSRYFVCNPATEKWIDLPDTTSMKSRYCYPVIRLGFDPTMSSHFTVFLLKHGDDFGQPSLVTGLEIYSSETGRWTYMPSQWGDGIRVGGNSRTAFFNSTLHLTTLESSMIAVDTDGKSWRKIPTPRNFGSIGLSQGRLYAVDNEDCSIWVLEDYVGEQWILKRVVIARGLDSIYMVHAFHPEHSLIFLIAESMKTLMSYDTNTRKVHAICTIGNSYSSIYPYVPCFSEWLSDGQ